MSANGECSKLNAEITTNKKTTKHHFGTKSLRQTNCKNFIYIRINNKDQNIF